MSFKSHIEGRNADVEVWPDRIEWSRQRGMSPKMLVGTLGVSALVGRGRLDTNMVPIRQIVGVSTHKAGIGWTTVKVTTGADSVEFRVSKGQAAEVKEAIQRAIAGQSA